MCVIEMILLQNRRIVAKIIGEFIAKIVKELSFNRKYIYFHTVYRA